MTIPNASSCTRLLTPSFSWYRFVGYDAFPVVDGYLAPGPASVGWAPGSAPSALDGRLSPQLTTISPGSLGDGRRREATLRRRGFDFCRQPLLFGPGFGFCGTTVMVVLARMSESARAGSATGISEPCNLPIEMCVIFRREVAGVARSRCGLSFSLCYARSAVHPSPSRH